MRLLILKCSSRKRGPSEPIPAIERYDGPLWQVLRAYLREWALWSADLDVYGLSAEYGLIPANTPIPNYERTMDNARAEELRQEVLDHFGDLMARPYEQLCLGVSHRYLRAMDGWERLVPEHLAVTMTDGPVGAKLGQLRAWLHGVEWDRSDRRPQRLEAPAQPRGVATLRGIKIALSRDEVLARAREELERGTPGARRYRDWYVLVGDIPVSTKWLVSVISGLPTSAFEASHARHVLLALGVDVARRPVSREERPAAPEVAD